VKGRHFQSIKQIATTTKNFFDIRIAIKEILYRYVVLFKILYHFRDLHTCTISGALTNEKIKIPAFCVRSSMFENREPIFLKFCHWPLEKNEIGSELFSKFKDLKKKFLLFAFVRQCLSKNLTKIHLNRVINKVEENMSNLCVVRLIENSLKIVFFYNSLFWSTCFLRSKRLLDKILYFFKWKI
jgi:hypothetical protein